MEVKAFCKQVEKRTVRRGGGSKGESGRIHVPPDWVDEEVLILRLGNPPHIMVDGKIAVENTLDEDGYTVLVLNSDSLKPTRVAMPDAALTELVAKLARKQKAE